MEIKLSPPDKTLPNLVSETYSDSQLLKIAQFNKQMHELDAQYPIECIREVDGNYRVSYLGDFSVAVIIFDKAGNRILGNVYSALKLRSDFGDLTNGKSLDYVQEIDPKGEYLFLYTGSNDTPRISTHFTLDGYLITIEYDSSNTISHIKEELI